MAVKKKFPYRAAVVACSGGCHGESESNCKYGCIGCGKCEKVCPLDNIRLKKGKPEWGGDCTHCMACICSCPREAIEYGKKTLGKRRYLCPEVYKRERK